MRNRKGYILQEGKDLWLVVESDKKLLGLHGEHLKDFVDEDQVAYPVIHEDIEAIFYACKAYLDNIN